VKNPFARRPRSGRRLIAAAAGLLAATALSVVATGAHAASTTSPELGCLAPGHQAARVGHISGIVHATQRHCLAHNTSDAAIGAPPLIFHGGPMMSTARTGPLVVTPIYWQPAGHPIDGKYESILNQYLSGVAADSGKHTNVFSTLNEYYGSNGNIRYKVSFGSVIDDTDPLPADGCTVATNDTTKIYADGSGYDSCLDDDQIIAETDHVVDSRGLPRDLAHIYVMFLPQHVESCFYGGSTTTGANFCTINHHKSAAYCAYHSQAPTGTVYANMPFPIYHSDAGYTCSSDARFATVQTPNGNADADTEVSPTSHEIMEATTDPDTVTGWFDRVGYENGDECAYVFGQTAGTDGQLYNQVIAGHQYLTQEEFSNNDFARTGLGCLPYE